MSAGSWLLWSVTGLSEAICQVNVGLWALCCTVSAGLSRGAVWLPQLGATYCTLAAPKLGLEKAKGAPSWGSHTMPLDSLWRLCGQSDHKPTFTQRMASERSVTEEVHHQIMEGFNDTWPQNQKNMKSLRK